MNNSQAQEGLSALQQLVADNCAWLGKETEPYLYFATRKALFYSGSTADLFEQAKAMSQAGSEDEWTVIPYPDSADHPLVLESGPSYFIFTGDANKELAAWLFIRWLIQPEQQIKLDQASWSIPVSQALRSDPARVGITSPQWETAVQLSAVAEEGPSSSTWYLARNVLSDAFRQVFQPETKEEDLPLLLQQLDSTIQDVANH
jgi:ABC-type glycerol-3-phosphate transport system substrate-binding protein